ncbi:MAG: P1 family peptidase [Halanaerobiales bacterium]|nr:P1 family peptidase [Halanaerobiales bacterium]
MEKIKLTDIEDFEFGTAQDEEAATGCTVILNKLGAVAGVDVRGGSPGTRETDLLDPVNLVQKIHGLTLSGGSAFGLDAASGVMQYLEEKDYGFDVGVTNVPIVSSAILFDLLVGEHEVRPDKQMGYNACYNLHTEGVPNGNFGAGAGASIGKYNGMKFAMKSGLGTYAIKINNLKIGAIVVVNCFGDIVNPENGNIIAGAFDKEKNGFLDAEEELVKQLKRDKNVFSNNTTIGAIITNAKLDKSEANKIASIAHDGYAKTMIPSHSLVDGDTIFTLTNNKFNVNLNTIGVLSVKVMSEAIINAVKYSKGKYGLKSFSDLEKTKG